jgi:hypothetical protein
VDGKTQTEPLELKLDPRVKVAQADLQSQFDLLIQIRDRLSQVHEAVNQIEDVRAQAVALKTRLPETASYRPFSAAADDLEKKLVAVRDPLINLRIRSNEDSLAFAPQLDLQLAALAMVVGGESDSAPTEAAVARFEVLKKQTQEALAGWAEVQKTDVSAFQKLAAERGVPAIVVPAPGSAVSAGEHEP